MQLLSYIDPMSGMVLVQIALAAIIGLVVRFGYGIKRMCSMQRTRDESPSDQCEASREQ